MIDSLSLARMIDYHPYDFLRLGPEVEARLKSWWIDQLLACPKDRASDLSGQSDSAIWFGRRLAWDSQFFGFGVGQLLGMYGDDLNYAVYTLELEAMDRGIRYLLATVPDESTALKLALGEAGWQLLETRVTFHRSLHNYDHPKGERYRVLVADKADLPALRFATKAAVNKFDRFHADPTLDKDTIDRLMDRWVEASVSREFADLVYVPDTPTRADSPTALAWMSAKFEREKWAAWGLKMGRPGNAAIHPNYSGWYTRLLSEICYTMRDSGMDHIYIPASAANRAVIAAWQNLGFKYGHTEHIFRIRL